MVIDRASPLLDWSSPSHPGQQWDDKQALNTTLPRTFELMYIQKPFVFQDVHARMPTGWTCKYHLYKVQGFLITKKLWVFQKVSFLNTVIVSWEAFLWVYLLSSLTFSTPLLPSSSSRSPTFFPCKSLVKCSSTSCPRLLRERAPASGRRVSVCLTDRQWFDLWLILVSLPLICHPAVACGFLHEHEQTFNS